MYCAKSVGTVKTNNRSQDFLKRLTQILYLKWEKRKRKSKEGRYNKGKGTNINWSNYRSKIHTVTI